MLLTYPNTLLRTKSLLVEDFSDLGIKQTVEEMQVTLDSARGLGLSAIQIGKPLQIILAKGILLESANMQTVEFSSESSINQDIQIFINPEITQIGPDSEESVQEGCLSFPEIYVWKTRPKFIVFTAADLTGSRKTFYAEDLAAQIILHETEHLAGQLLIDGVSNIKKQTIEKKMRKFNKLHGTSKHI